MAGKQPKLVLRESCIHDVSQQWPVGRFLEMGAGTGHMTKIFLSRGFWGAASDLGEDSREMMRRNLADAGERIRVFEPDEDILPESFDYLFAFEVLEHIENDQDVLREWATYLRPGGRLLVSVPAHARKYGRSDEIVGHVRRYEKKQLQDLMSGSGFDQVKVVNYGYPLTELTRSISNRLIAKDKSYDAMPMEERSIRSAQKKPQKINCILSMTNEKMFIPFCFIQRMFYRLDLGDGYVAQAVKVASKS